MSEFLCKYRGLAPWLGMAGALVINVMAIAYWSGALNQRLSELDRRVVVLEVSDKEQLRWLERIAGMESTMNYIRDELKAHRSATNGGGK